MISQDELKHLLSYNPSTGEFRRRVARRGMARRGSIAGSPDKKGYLRIYIRGRTYKAHRLAWLYVTGRWPAGLIDHKDGNPANNRLSNLRVVTNAQNGHNRAPTLGRVGLKGVYHEVRVRSTSRPWRARITVNGRLRNLGTYHSKNAAVRAYNRAAKQLYGEYARENVVAERELA